MTIMELAVAHGYLSATRKGYAEKRGRERERHHPPSQTGKVNVSGWEKLASMWKGPLQHGGDRLIGEVA